MRRMTSLAALSVVGSAPAAARADHVHVKVDTDNGQIKIVIGYPFGEEAFYVDRDG